MPRTALIVDDSVSMRQMVAYTLRQAGFDVVEAGDGQQGLNEFDRHKVDIVITDLNMPVMDGIALIRHVRSRPSGRYIPLLMLTTESQAEKKQEGRAAGATGWIVKPFHPARLIEVIGKVLH